MNYPKGQHHPSSIGKPASIPGRTDCKTYRTVFIGILSNRLYIDTGFLQYTYLCKITTYTVASTGDEAGIHAGIGDPNIADGKIRGLCACKIPAFRKINPILLPPVGQSCT